MTAEIWVWIAIALAIVLVGLWPILTRNRRPKSDPTWTAEGARTRMAELEDQLDLPDLPEKSRSRVERSLILAGAALAKGGRKAPARAGQWAEAGLTALRNSAG